MNGCEKYQELISSLIDGELSEKEKSELAEHLKHCPECSALYEAFSGLSESLRDDVQELPSGLHENIMAEIRRSEIKKKNRPSKPVKAFLASAACIALIVAALFSLPEKPENAVMLSSAAEDAVTEEAAVAEGAFEAEFFRESTAPAAEQEAPQSPEAPVKSDEARNSASLFSAGRSQEPPLYELTQERYADLISLLSGSSCSVNEDELPPVSFNVCPEGEYSGVYLSFYRDENVLIYYDSEASSYFSAGCSYDELVVFLNIL